MVHIEVGTKAPAFRLQDKDGRTWTLDAFKGQNLILYFYPKADTPGCAREACGFRDELETLATFDTQVVGISPDSQEKLAQFADKHDLGFVLLSDPDHSVAETYGVWKEKSMYGKRFWGIERTTFILDSEARIVKVYPRVRVNGHVEKVVEELRRTLATV